MIINHNISALNTHRQLSANNNAVSNSLEKLSSGLRINRAGDDAAGLAISEKMRGQIRGLEMASKNAQDGISLIQTAEGALNETHSILQRMRELAVQAANGTNSDTDRGEIQKEIVQLKSELNRVSTDTEFNTKKLLNGSLGATATLDATNAAELVGVEVLDTSLKSGDYTITVANSSIDVENFQAGGTGVADTNLTIGTSVAAGSYSIEISGDSDDATVILRDANGTELASAVNQDTTAGNVAIGGITIAQNAYNGTSGTFTFDVAISADVTVADVDGNSITVSGAKANLADSTIEAGGFAISVNGGLTDAATTANVINNSVVFQIGANEGQSTKLAIGKMDSASLGVADIDVRTTEDADKAVTTIQNAIEKVSAERSKLGAVQNRLEHTINNLGTSAENLTAAESRIRDVDMAAEMMEFTKNNILTQAAQAMLAQANQTPQGVLQLLR